MSSLPLRHILLHLLVLSKLELEAPENFSIVLIIEVFWAIATDSFIFGPNYDGISVLNASQSALLWAHDQAEQRLHNSALADQIKDIKR